MQNLLPSLRGAALVAAVIVSALVSPLAVVAANDTTASTEPSSDPSQAAADRQVCVNSDPVVGDVSGLVAVDDGYAVINDRGSNEPTSQLYLLGDDCALTQTLTAPRRPVDVEDLARTGDGTYWLADIGDNDSVRPNVVMQAMKPSGSADAVAVTEYVLRYPQGARNAEAVLITDDRTPVIVTKSQDGVAEVYIATRRLSGEPVAARTLRKAGELTLKPTGTPGGARDGVLDEANVLVTGGAVSHDGRRVALRTYTDTYEWRVPRHASATQIARVLLAQTPDRTPMPGEAQGEAVAYSSDDTRLLSVSEGTGKPLQAWKPVRSATDGDDGAGTGGWLIGGAVGVVAVAAVAAVLLWRRRVQRR